MPVLARRLRGIEWIAAAEIRATFGVTEIVHGHRELRFSLPQLTPDLRRTPSEWSLRQPAAGPTTRTGWTSRFEEASRFGSTSTARGRRWPPGSIPIEAKLACPRLGAAGFDLYPQALRAARPNAKAAGVEVALALADAAKLPLGDASVDRIVTNPPWGSAVDTAGLAADPALLWSELRRVLAPDGRIALLTPLQIPVARTELEPVLEERVRISGAVVSVRVLARQGSSGPFDTTGLYGRELSSAATDPARKASL